MDNGKAAVLNAIAKQTVPFKPSKIVDLTGLDRRLVNYHLAKFTERGWLQHYGQVYEITSLDLIVDALTDVAVEPSKNKKPEARGLVSASTANSLGEFAKRIGYLKRLRAPESVEMATHYNQVLDETIAYFKSVKRYLNNAQPSIRTAAKYAFADKSLFKDFASAPVHWIPTMKYEAWAEQVEQLAEAVLNEQGENSLD